jgi:type IV fimbrial biogenesis protein FimT
MVAITIMAIMVGVAAPQLDRFLQSQRITSAHNQLLTSLRGARSEAVKRSQPIIVCNGSAANGCKSNNAWQKGWYVATVPQSETGCRDQDGNGQCDSHGGTVLRRHEGFPDGLSLSANGIRLPRSVRFNPLGRAEGYAGTISICPTSDADVQGSGIVINVSGRMRRAEPGDLNC